MELKESIRVLYRGTLRILLVLLHDYPDFLAGYHLPLCNVIPNSCIQLRNLILSAFPINMKLPDPFTPDLKVDLLPETRTAPAIMSDLTVPLEKAGLKTITDSYFSRGSGNNTLAEIKKKLYSKNELVVSLLNALTLYLGLKGIEESISGSSSSNGSVGSTSLNLEKNPAIVAFQFLMRELTSEGIY